MVKYESSTVDHVSDQHDLDHLDAIRRGPLSRFCSRRSSEAGLMSRLASPTPTTRGSEATTHAAAAANGDDVAWQKRPRLALQAQCGDEEGERKCEIKENMKK